MTAQAPPSDKYLDQVVFQNPDASSEQMFHLEKRFHQENTSDFWDALLSTYEKNFLAQTLEAQLFLQESLTDYSPTGVLPGTEEGIAKALKETKNEIIWSKSYPHALYMQARNLVIHRVMNNRGKEEETE